MARTGQPSTRRRRRGGRAVEILDALAEAASSARTRSRAARGISASTVSRQLGTLARAELVEHVDEHRPLPARRAADPARRTPSSADSTCGTSPARTSRSSCTTVGETATLSIPGDGDAITVDFVPTDHYLQGVTRLGRPSIGHATSAGKVMLAFGDAHARGPAARLHGTNDHGSGRARSARSRRCARRG